MEQRTDHAVALSDERADLLTALERLFAIGAFYPPGHARCVQVAESFRAAMAPLLAGAPALTIDTGRDALALQGHIVGLESRAAAKLHGLLAELAIARLEIDAAVSPRDLHDLVAFLIQARHQLDSAYGFQRVEFAALPPTVRAHQREFGRRVGGGAGCEATAELVEAAVGHIMRELESASVPESVREKYRGVFSRMFERAAERLELAAQAPGGGRPPFARSLEEVLDLGVHAVQRSLDQLLSHGDGLDDLARVFAQAERAIALSDDRESVELMVDVLRQAAHDADEAADEPAIVDDAADADARYRVPLPELRRAVEERSRAGPPPDDLAPRDQAERLSVLLQVLLESPGGPATTAAAQQLRETLGEGRPGRRERSVLAGALRAVFAAADPAAVDRLAPFVLEGLRDGGVPPAGLLAEACGDLAGPATSAAWPHAANELLQWPAGGDADVFERLATLVSRAGDDGDERARLLRLDGLSALRERRCGARLFCPVSPELHGLYAHLLASAVGDQAGEHLLAALRDAPPAWPGGEVVHLLDDFRPQLRPLVARLAREAAAPAPSAQLQAALGRLLAESLPRLPVGRRGEPWVAAAVRALGALAPPEAGVALTGIRRARRFLLLPAWPASCRAAAREALRALHARPATAAPTKEACP